MPTLYAAVNRTNPDRWKMDIAESVDMYNTWFFGFAPATFRTTRIATTKGVAHTLKATDNLATISVDLLRDNPSVLPSLRMSTCPPIAVDRLIGLGNVNPNLVRKMEEGQIPTRMERGALVMELRKTSGIIQRMADPDIFTWLEQPHTPSKEEIYRAATIVADRLCGSVANPIIRNAQEQRQLAHIAKWLDKRGYRQILVRKELRFNDMAPGTYGFRCNVHIRMEGGNRVNIPVDTVIMPRSAPPGSLPLLGEAKSANYFTNVNKRRKEEAAKTSQLRATYGPSVRLVLFLCGYFDTGYLGYEAAEGIDWVWEHRIEDFCAFGL